MKKLIVKSGGIPVQVQQTLSSASGLPVTFLLRDLHSGSLGQKTDSIRKWKIFNVHDEVDDATALFAAEAVIDLLVRRDGEGAGLFTVEGAQAEQVAALAGQLYVTAYHVHNITAGGQLVHKALGKCHGRSSFHELNGHVKLYPAKGEFPLFLK